MPPRIPRAWTMRVLISLLISFVIISSISKAFGGFIKMDANVTSTVRTNEVAIETKIANRGDESAQEITVDASFPSGKSSSPTISKLEAGREKILTFRSPIVKGFLRNIVPLIISYKDQKGHRFSAVSYGIIDYSASESSRVFAKIGPTELSRQETLTLSASSVDGKPHRVGIRIIVPNELSTFPETKEMDIPPSGEVYASFTLRTLYAIPNSTYSVLGIVSERREQGVYEDVAVGQVSIVAGRSISKIFSGKAILYVLALLTAFYVLYQLIARKTN